MFGKTNNPKKDKKFYIKSNENLGALGKVIVLVDSETGVNYLQFASAGSSITPLLDENGKVIVDKV